MRTFGEDERVLVDGEPGKVIASPKRHVYLVELDSGEVVERMGATLKPFTGSKPEDRLVLVHIEHRPVGEWKLILRNGLLGQILYEAGGLNSLDEALEQLDQWRKGVIIV